MAAPVQRHKANNSPTMFEDELPTEANVDNEHVHLEGNLI